jgi:GxxExxY protein
MDTNEHESIDDLIEKVVVAAYEVSNVLGCGFLEKVYDHAMQHELRVRGLPFQSQVRYMIRYKTKPVGEYRADLVVNRQLVVELKCAEAFSDEHLAQCINYLKASGLRFALLINFHHPKVRWKRIVYGF